MDLSLRSYILHVLYGPQSCLLLPEQLSSYGLCFLGVWFGFSNQVLSNAWFYSKTFPFGAVFYMLASYF